MMIPVTICHHSMPFCAVFYCFLPCWLLLCYYVSAERSLAHHKDFLAHRKALVCCSDLLTSLMFQALTAAEATACLLGSQIDELKKVSFMFKSHELFPQHTCSEPHDYLV